MTRYPGLASRHQAAARSQSSGRIPHRRASRASGRDALPFSSGRTARPKAQQLDGCRTVRSAAVRRYLGNDDERVAAEPIGHLAFGHQRCLAVLIFLEEWEWARQGLIEELS
jgi:hypothetical protein